MMVTTLCINKCHHAFTHSQFSSSRFTHTTFATHGATHNWNNSNAESNTRKNNFLPLLLHIIYVLYVKNKLGQIITLFILNFRGTGSYYRGYIKPPERFISTQLSGGLRALYQKLEEKKQGLCEEETLLLRAATIPKGFTAILLSSIELTGRLTIG